ncbi:MAG: hypothetical protein Q8K40_02635 [Ignavibacteria bacterium]|nr:hypothetical protein [Ignavibacteria bacterium]
MSDKNPSVRVPREIILQTAEATKKLAEGKPELLKFGINETYLTAFAADIVTAKSFMNDDALSDETKGTTKEKNIQLDLCYQWLGDAEFLFHKKFKKKTPQFVEFPSKISQYADSESAMIDLLPNVFKLLTKYKTDLTDMQVDFISTGEAYLSDMNAKNTVQKAKKKDDTKYTAARKAAGSVLYEKVNEINEAGNRAYKNDPVMKKLFKSPWPRKGNGGGEEDKTPPAPPAS